jgi:hypothetical protein
MGHSTRQDGLVARIGTIEVRPLQQRADDP